MLCLSTMMYCTNAQSDVMFANYAFRRNITYAVNIICHRLHHLPARANIIRLTVPSLHKTQINSQSRLPLPPARITRRSRVRREVARAAT